jgi:SAM-dependent methyltransferase
MERVVYERMAQHADRHWWYRARREVLARLIASKIALPPEPRLLEIGCGTGHNLDMLGRFGPVDATELDDAAREIASARLGRPVIASRLPELPRVADATYDLIAILDVLEHVDADREALVSMGQKLRPGGRILITVPAHPWMWSAHDTVNHHKRRYTKATLAAVVAEAGLKLEWQSYFNSMLFPLAAGSRLAGRLMNKDDSGDSMPSAPVNRLFEALFGLERYAIGKLPFPPGVSIAAIVSAS